MFYILGAVAISAAVLAIYERRKKRRLLSLEGSDPTRDPARAAYTDAERIRAEASVSNPPQGGGIF